MGFNTSIFPSREVKEAQGNNQDYKYESHLQIDYITATCGCTVVTIFLHNSLGNRCGLPYNLDFQSELFLSTLPRISPKSSNLPSPLILSSLVLDQSK